MASTGHAPSRAIAEVLREWAKDITDKLDPPRRISIAAACPVCAVSTVYRTDSGGDRVRVPALAADVARGCNCQACGAIWRPDQFLWLCRVLGFPVPVGVLE